MSITKYILDVSECEYLTPRWHIFLWTDAFTRGEGQSEWLWLAFVRAWRNLKDIQKKGKGNNPIPQDCSHHLPGSRRV